MDMHLNLKETTYKNYMDAQSGNRDRIAIFTTHGEEITHGRLMEEIDEIAASITVQLEGKPAKIGVLSISEYQEAVFFIFGLFNSRATLARVGLSNRTGPFPRPEG